MPRTLIGRMIRAQALASEDVPFLSSELDRTQSWRADRRSAVDAVLHEAFELIICRRFTPETDVRYITAWVANLKAHYKADRMSVIVGEALVRAALGEWVQTDDISAVEATLPRYLLFCGAYADLHWRSDGEKYSASLDTILVEAERRAAAKGQIPVTIEDVGGDSGER